MGCRPGPRPGVGGRWRTFLLGWLVCMRGEVLGGGRGKGNDAEVGVQECAWLDGQGFPGGSQMSFFLFLPHAVRFLPGRHLPHDTRHRASTDAR